MRKLLILISTLSLVAGIAAVPSSAVSAKAKITPPAAPTIVSIVSSLPKKGKVNLKVTISLPTENGGSTIKGSKVTAGGKSCTIKKTKTSCTLKSIKAGKLVSVSAKSRNKKGFGRLSAKVSYVAGAGTYSAAPISHNCATGGSCLVGDRGPGGGIVFYVSPANFTSAGSTCGTACKYLEVAPATWQSSGASVHDDNRYAWSTNVSMLTAQDTTTQGTESSAGGEHVNYYVGQGFYNTSVMKLTGATSQAQAAVLAYAGNSIAGQWFIPSSNELNELCKYAYGQSTGDKKVECEKGSPPFKSTLNAGSDLGGFVEYSYFSSSEYFIDAAVTQNFATGGRGLQTKNDEVCVRPIRAF